MWALFGQGFDSPHLHQFKLSKTLANTWLEFFLIRLEPIEYVSYRSVERTRIPMITQTKKNFMTVLRKTETPIQPLGVGSWLSL